MKFIEIFSWFLATIVGISLARKLKHRFISDALKNINFVQEKEKKGLEKVDLI